MLSLYNLIHNPIKFIICKVIDEVPRESNCDKDPNDNLKLQIHYKFVYLYMLICHKY